MNFPGAENNASFASRSKGFLLPGFVRSSVFLSSERAPCLVASRGRRRGGAAVGGCASSAAGRHPIPGRCVSARVHRSIVPAPGAEREWDAAIFSGLLTAPPQRSGCILRGRPFRGLRRDRSGAILGRHVIIGRPVKLLL